MKMILFASLATIALASCTNQGQSSADSRSCPRLFASLDPLAAIPTACPFRQDPSYADPTGELVRGPHGEISLYGVHSGGSR